MRDFILIPHLKIHNANAMSSPYTIGFPAMTAWMGAVHALQRHLNASGFQAAKFFKVAVSCHKLDVQTHKGNGDFVHSVIATANPLGKNGSRPAFIEEARCHLEVSILIEYSGINPNDLEAVKTSINEQVHRMKWASGDLLRAKKCEQISLDEDETSAVKKLLSKLMLGHVLISRRDLMEASMNEGNDALSALLDHLKVMHRSSEEKEGEVTWRAKRKEIGWIVPIAVGFQGISPLGIAKNQRDLDTPHRFVESVITLGEFKMPHRIRKLNDMLWEYHVDLEKNMYLCFNQPTSNNI